MSTELEYDFDYDSAQSVVDPSTATDAANAAMAAVLSDVGPAPEIDLPADDTVSLPGGLVTPDGVLHTATVRELTGEDEEALAKARNNPVRFINTLLRSGVDSIGDEPVDAKVLKSLLIGDREALVLGIRIATFGEKVEFVGLRCPGCEDTLDVDYNLKTIPTKRLDDPEVREFKVDLRKGGSALVRLPDGADQEAVLESGATTAAEENTLMLSRIVLEYNGKKVNKSKEIVKGIGIADRKTILTFVNENQPGPRYDEVTVRHDACDTKVPLYLSVGDLFRDI